MSEPMKIRPNAMVSENLETARMNLELAADAIKRAASELTRNSPTSEEADMASRLRELSTNLTMIQMIVMIASMGTKVVDESKEAH